MQAIEALRAEFIQAHRRIQRLEPNVALLQKMANEQEALYKRLGGQQELLQDRQTAAYHLLAWQGLQVAHDNQVRWYVRLTRKQYKRMDQLRELQAAVPDSNHHPKATAWLKQLHALRLVQDLRISIEANAKNEPDMQYKY